jgi:hypothetical protein
MLSALSRSSANQEGLVVGRGSSSPLSIRSFGVCDLVGRGIWCVDPRSRSGSWDFSLVREDLLEGIEMALKVVSVAGDEEGSPALVEENDKLIG